MRTSGLITTIFSLLFSISAFAVPSNSSNSPWTGNWSRTGSGKFQPAELDISKIDDKGFEFSLTAQNGANDGEITGRATFRSDGAFFKSPEKDVDCEVTFKKGTEALEVETSEGCSYYGGQGVWFSGKFGHDEPKEEELSLYDRGIFSSTEEEDAFKALVGDKLEAFLDTIQLTSDEKDLDNLGAEVTRSGVRGLFTIQESLIMHDKSGRIWAAVLVPSDSDKKVFYFTNVKEFANRLPKTFENWRAEFKEAPILFSYKGN